MSWEPFVVHTSTEPTIDAVVQSRSRHWQRYLHDRCPDDDCQQHPITVTDLLERIDPDQGFMKGNRIP